MPSGVDDTASSLSRYSMASTNVSHITANIIGVSDYRPAKRRRTAGLNTRFDRMIKSVNASLSYRTTSPALSRKRVESSSTSSTSSHDVPKTPLDLYSNLHPGKLGKDFSLMKPNTSLLPREHSRGFHKLAEPSKEPKDPLPDWLASTFCSLEAGHPLRGLLSPSRVNRSPKCNSPPPKLPVVSHEEEIFAFSPFDKQEEVPNAAYRAQTTLDISKDVSSGVYAEPALSNRKLARPASPVPFSTPGRYASVRMSREGPIADSVFQKPVVSAPQQVTSQATDMMHPAVQPSSPLRLPDTIEWPQFARTFSNLIPENNDPPSKCQELGPYISHIPQVSRGADSRLNVYATPGPTFACSRPVYFDSPTEDPSLSDPLDPESYELDLNAIDFRWRPFLRSSTQENITVRQSTSPSSPLGHIISNQAGDQNGWNTRFAVDQGGYGASNEELPSLANDLEVPCLDDASAIQPSNMNTTSTISNPVGPWSPPINNVLNSALTFVPGVLLSPLRDQPSLPSLAAGGPQPRGDRENIDTSEKLPLFPGGLPHISGRESEAKEGGPSTPIRQSSVPPPRAPQKVRSSQLLSAAPVRKTASALSWMIPLKSSKHATMGQNDVNYPHSHVTGNLNSHDSIESWGDR